MESKIEHVIKLIRKTPIFRQLIPQEAGIGWPIPLRRENRVYVKLTFFGYRPLSGKSVLYPPFALLTLDWSNGLLVEYVNLRFNKPEPSLDWEGQAGTFPHPAVAGMKRSQYQEQRHALLSMYDELFDTLARGGTLPETWENRFKQLLETLVEPPLIPYYRALAPKFFNRFLRTAEAATGPMPE